MWILFLPQNIDIHFFIFKFLLFINHYLGDPTTSVGERYHKTSHSLLLRLQSGIHIYTSLPLVYCYVNSLVYIHIYITTHSSLVRLQCSTHIHTALPLVYSIMFLHLSIYLVFTSIASILFCDCVYSLVYIYIFTPSFLVRLQSNILLLLYP